MAEKVHNRLLNATLSVGLPLLLRTVGNFSSGMSRFAARVLGWVLSVFNRGGMRLVCANLRVAFPEKSESEIKRLAKANMFHQMWNGIDFIRLLKHPEKAASFVDEMELPDDLREPFIMTLPHLGSWELLAQAMPHYLKHPCAAVAASFPYPKLNEILERSRSVNGLDIIWREGAARGMMTALHKGNNVGILIDQNLSPKHGGIFVDFFGLPVPTSPLPAIVAQRRHIPLVSAVCVRKPNGLFHISVVSLPDATDTETPTGITQRLIAANEELIRKWPEQYTWLYKRWFYTPTDIEPESKKRLPFYAKPPKYAINNN